MTVLALLGDLDDGLLLLLLLLAVGEDLDWLLELSGQLLLDGLLVLRWSGELALVGAGVHGWLLNAVGARDHWDWADWAGDLDAWVLLLQSQLGQLVLQVVQHLLDGSQAWLLDLLAVRRLLHDGVDWALAVQSDQ